MAKKHRDPKEPGASAQDENPKNWWRTIPERIVNALFSWKTTEKNTEQSPTKDSSSKILGSLFESEAQAKSAINSKPDFSKMITSMQTTVPLPPKTPQEKQESAPSEDNENKLGPS